jgi:uncharacterized protein (TIGR02118 family)
MIEITVVYPVGLGSKFDMAYYCEKHIPMVKELLGPALKGVAVEQGIGGLAPGSRAPYHALAHLRFESMEALKANWGPHGEQIGWDVQNYTNTQPIIQFSEIQL